MKSIIVTCLVIFPLGYVLGYINQNSHHLTDTHIGGKNIVSQSQQQTKVDPNPQTSKLENLKKQPEITQTLAKCESQLSNNSFAQLNSDELIHLLTQARLQTDSQTKTNKLTQLTTQLATINPELALDWLKNQDDIGALNTLYYPIVTQYMQQDLEKAGDIILYLENSETKQDLIETYINELAKHSPLDAIDWSYNLFDPAQINAAQQAALQNWATKEPSEVMNYLSIDSELPDNIRTQIISQASIELAKKDIHSTPQFINQLPENLQANAAYGMVSEWVQQDKTSALSWVETQPQSQIKDKAIQSFIDYSPVNSNFEQQFNLITHVQDHASRMILLSSVIEQWYQQDTHAAEQRINNSELTEAEKLFLLSKAKLN